ncbi:MAG: ferrous iron transport protein A [Selenomonas sp.]|nr:ferrous iron transport protein A [Selenomonas sp.]MBQ2314730.1 ferrous iron transport protein A [Treponema sp.]MBQ5501920.1 ferrous iron transport protein A [Selenomonas sp.]
MPLSFSKTGESVKISRINGNESVKKHLSDLGFVVGEKVSVISAIGNGNIIVKVKETRVAIDRMLADKIIV